MKARKWDSPSVGNYLKRLNRVPSIVESLLQEADEVHIIDNDHPSHKETFCGMGTHEIDARAQGSGDTFIFAQIINDSGYVVPLNKTMCLGCIKGWQTERYRGD